MKRLLMIAYDFPPMLPGVRRTLAFIRYLQEFGWEPSVLTVKPIRTWAYDDAPLEELRERGIAIHRSESLDPYRLAYIASRVRHGMADFPRQHASSAPAKRSFTAGILRHMRRNWLCPDDRVGWVNPAVQLARQVIGNEMPQAIWTTSYPHSAHLVGLRIKSLYPHLSWVADFRDGWTQNADFFPQLSPSMRQKSAELERQVARATDAITAISEPITEHFRQLNAGDSKPVITLPNGFDKQDIEKAVPRKWPGFSFLYSGTIYGDRTAEPIFQAAAEACRRSADLARELRLVFVGAFGQDLRDLATRHGLADRLIIPGTMSYLESLGAQKGADALILLLAETPNVEIILTQKIFEYLATRRPVWTLTPSSSACAKLVEELQAGVVADPASPETGAQALVEIYDSVRSGHWNAPPAERLQPFSRRHQTGQLAEILDVLVAPEAKKP